LRYTLFFSFGLALAKRTISFVFPMVQTFYPTSAPFHFRASHLALHHELKYDSVAYPVGPRLMIKRGQKLVVFGLVALTYVLFVPIIPFQRFYNVDPNNSSALGKAWLSGLFYFDVFTRPAGVPAASANFGVWGQQSVSAYFLNFGVVSNDVCAFNPSYDTMSGIGLLPLTVPITVLVVLGLASLLFYEHGFEPAPKSAK
jgi:hypothetical protein